MFKSPRRKKSSSDSSIRQLTLFPESQLENVANVCVTDQLASPGQLADGITASHNEAVTRKGMVNDKNDELSARVEKMAEKFQYLNFLVKENARENIAAFMSFDKRDPGQIHNFLSSLLKQHLNGRTINMDFHAAGLDMTMDVIALLKHCAKADARLKPTVISIAYLLNNYGDLHALYKWCKEEVAGLKEDYDFEPGIKMLKNRFHIFHDVEKDGSCSDADKELIRTQREWQMQGIRRAFNHFLRTTVARYFVNLTPVHNF